MHLLHASFGIGATLGPLVVAALLESDVSWRFAYGLLVLIEGSLLLALFSLRSTPVPEIQEDTLAGRKPTAARPGLALAATLLYFSLYVGVEVSVGLWSFSILTESRGYGNGEAGLALSGYWGGLTIGRLLLGAINRRLSPETLLRGTAILSIGAAGWFWQNLAGSALALVILGFAFAGVFPSLVLLTPGWLGRDRVVRAVGYQLAASSAGAIVASFVIGRIAAGENGLDALPATFLIMTGLLGAAHIFTEWATRPG